MPEPSGIGDTAVERSPAFANTPANDSGVALTLPSALHDASRSSKSLRRSLTQLLSKAQSLADEITTLQLQKARKTSPSASQRLHNRNTRLVRRLLTNRSITTKLVAA
jgi:hypothetical protein